jgi:HAD superfamily hydrolase (TIGR01490 family)
MRAAAVFDLDGTLLPYTSAESLFLRFLLKKRVLTPRQAGFYLARFFQSIGNWENMTLNNMHIFRGYLLEELREHGRRCFLPRIDELISTDMQHCIAYHRKKGDMLAMISAAPSFLLEIFSSALAFDECRGTELECIAGRLSGNIRLPRPKGRVKLAILKEMRSKYDLDFAECFVYANSHTDSFLLQRVGHPIVVNPDKELERTALRSGWISFTAHEMDRQYGFLS